MTIEGTDEFREHYYQAHVLPTMTAMKMKPIAGMRHDKVIDAAYYLFGLDAQPNAMHDPDTPAVQG